MRADDRNPTFPSGDMHREPSPFETAVAELLPGQVIVVHPDDGWRGPQFDVRDLTDPFQREMFRELASNVERDLRRKAAVAETEAADEQWSPQHTLTRAAVRCVRFLTRPLERSRPA